MKFIRSTEKSINLLGKSRLVSTSLRTKRVAQADGNPLLASSKFNKRPFSSLSSYVRFNPRIKLYKGLVPTANTKLSLLSTNVSVKSETPFLNPNKPGPDDIKELVAQPIVPLTHARFSRSDTDIPSVTKVLQATMPASARFLLDRWKETMIKKLGLAGFATYQKETFERGRALHALLADFLLGHGEPTEGKAELSKEIVSNLWKSIHTVVKDNVTNVRLVEHTVTHPSMNYRGIVDCVAFYKDELVVIDFKTAEKPKKNLESLYDNPLQVTAYCGAINSDPNIPIHVIDRNISSGLVIVAYVDGSEASVYYLDSKQVAGYWKKWTDRLDQFSRMEEMNPEKDKKTSLKKH